MYDSFAAYYDLFHSSLAVDIDYILGLANEAKGPILELGCGTGRLLIPLARSGFSMTGVDNTPAMLLKARDHLKKEPLLVQQRVSLIKGDMKVMSLSQKDNYYSLILLPYNTLLHFQPTEVQQLLRNCSRYLANEGRLFIDVINPFVIEETSCDPEPTVENIYYDQESGDSVKQMSQSRLDSTAQCLHISWIFEERTGDEKYPSRTKTIEFDYWYQYPHQLELHLQQSGYRIEQMIGDYDGSPFDHSSERLLISARRVKNE